MARLSWVEWEGPPPPLNDASECLVLTALGHPDRLDDLRDGLVVELGQGGYVTHFGDAYRMAHAALLSYGWYGYIEGDVVPVFCFSTGRTPDEDQVDRALPCVYALLTESHQA